MNALNPLVLDLAVKGTLLLLAAFAVALLLRRSSAAARHLHWQLALSGLLALPLLAAVTPRIAVPVGPLAALLAPVRDNAPESGRLKGAALRERHPDTLRAQGEDPGRGPQAVQPETERPAAPATSPAAEARRAGERKAEPRRPAFAFLLALTPLQQALLAWGAGTVALLGMLAIGLLRAAALTRGATPITDPAWLSLTDRIRRELVLRRVVALRRVPRCVVPMTFGWRRPVVLLPADADQWCASRRRHVLLHELAHVRRSDWLGQLAAQVACALWWWQPLAWIAARELRRQRELACDDQVLAFGSRASEYADHLLAIAASRGTGLATGVATLAMARRSQLEGRLLAVLAAGRQRRGPTPRRALAAAAGAAALVAALACVQPEAESPVIQTTTHEDGQFVLQRRSDRLQGTVLDAQGQPVPEATVEVRTPGASDAPAPDVDVRLRRSWPRGEVPPEMVAPRAAPPSPRSVVLAPELTVTPAPPAPQLTLNLVPQVQVSQPALPGPHGRIHIQGSLGDDELGELRSLGYMGDITLSFGNGQCTSVWGWSVNDDRWSVMVKGDVEPDETGTRPAWLDEDSSFVIEHEQGGQTERVEAVADDDDGGVVWSGTSGGQTLDADAARAAAERMLPTVLAHTGLFASQRVAHLVETSGPSGALAAIREMPADGSRTDLLCVLLTEHELETADFAAALELAAEGGGSEASLAEMLGCIGADALGDPDLVEPLFRAVETIESDSQQAETIGCLLGSEYADAPVLTRGLTAATEGVESDAYMADLLGQVPASRLRDAAVRDAFVAALATVESDAYAAEAFERLPDARGVRGETLAALLSAAAQSIDSDAYMAEVLGCLPDRALGDETARPAMLSALATIESDAYYAEVAESWLAHDATSPEFAAALIAAAAQHVDSDPYLAEILTAPEALRDVDAVRAAVEAALAGMDSRSYATEVREWLSREE